MRNFKLGLTIAFCTLWVCSAPAADQGHESFPNMVGTWVATPVAHTLKGSRKTYVEIKITEQEGPYFKGMHIWRDDEKQEPVMDAGGKLTHKASEPILGVFGFDGKTIYIAEHNDLGTLHWRLVDPNTAQSVYVESGPHAVVGRTIYRRKQ